MQATRERPLSLQRPRRIFRATTPRVRLHVVVGGVGGLLLALCVGLMLLGMTYHPRRITALPARLAAASRQVAVVDGGTLRVKNHVVRLLGVTPPPRGRACRLADGTHDCAAVAADALAALVRSTRVRCDVRGEDDRGRALAVCNAEGRQLNRAMIAGGWDRATGSFPALRQAEAKARADRRGLWVTAQTW